jgi:hypothetical protein
MRVRDPPYHELTSMLKLKTNITRLISFLRELLIEMLHVE